MSTASLPALDVQRPQSGSLWLRFAWKEYRMLRGFWLAILVLGVLEQWVSTLMMIDDHVIPGWLFTSAWGAAALYAVGAAVTLFGAENEERTRGFLQLLPGRWQPMFFAKLAVAVGSSILLAGVLCLTGWLIAGGIWPSAEQCQLSLAVAGVAIVEALVWGLLFSLLWKQPLMAAVAAMAAASFGSQLAVLATPLARDSFSAESYQAAVPMRLAICLVVFAIDVVVGRRWLAPLGMKVPQRRKRAGEVALVAAKPQAAVAPWRRRMFARLLWQTWRESWKTILAAIGLGLFLTISSLGIIQALTRIDFPLTFLVPPALLGALVFRGDQKRDHRLFLATHSARPRYVWLARQVVWLGALAILAGGVQWWVSDLTQELFITELDQHFHGYWGQSFLHWPGEPHNTNWLWSWKLQRAAGLLNQLLVLGWCAIFAAYAVGQVCSLAFKREVLPGFLAILFSIVLAAWSLVVFAWQLNPLWFVLPIGIGAMLATWLRIPDWLVGKKQLRSWLAPAVVMGLPLLMLLRLPNARLTQMDLPWPEFPYLKEPLEESLQAYKELQIARNETANRIRQVELNMPSFPRLDELTIDGKSWEEFSIEDPGYDFRGVTQQSPEDREIADRFEQEGNRVFLEANRDAIAKIIEATENSESLTPAYGFEEEGYYFGSSTQSMLLSIDAKQQMIDAKQQTADGELEKAWKSIRAIIRFDLSDRHDTHINDQLILNWAQHHNQTSEQIKSAIEDLEETFKSVPHPRESVLRRYLKTRKVILEEQLPNELSNGGNRVGPYLAFLANKLPWERDRALQALDYLATQALNYVDATLTASPREFREKYLSLPWSMNYAVSEIVFDKKWKDFERACALTDASRTSYLTAKEFGNGDNFSSLLLNWANAETRRRALLTQLALIAYRLDHGDYPATLAELVPEYLAKMIVDPFSGNSYEYRPELDVPLLYTTYMNSDLIEIPAGTALLWSVGFPNVRLERVENYAPMDRGGGYGGEGGYGESFGNAFKNYEPPQSGRTVYFFRGTDRPYMGSTTLVFPLPAEQ